MDYRTRNETIGALLAACAAEVRSRPARALRAHSAVAGEVGFDDECESDGSHMPAPRSFDRDLPIAPERNRYTGALRGAKGDA